ncbi:hypothetical protein MSG28_006041 [Choristoneura fumiferana]|uniref:Uncharacterized protein n=1 Tax=Choristoneura fumiferana TaxID=7141 RepID=A0ACC0JDA8_CHOFU|nr:hypothetical protein MSG28_006041 [Choristoneura fumiferana]
MVFQLGQLKFQHNIICYFSSIVFCNCWVRPHRAALRRRLDGPSARAPPIPPLDWAALDASGDVFEKCSLLTAALTQLGFYVLLLLGYLNQLLFPPNVATEKNREKDRTTRTLSFEFRSSPAGFSVCVYPSPVACVTSRGRDANGLLEFDGAPQRHATGVIVLEQCKSLRLRFHQRCAMRGELNV